MEYFEREEWHSVSTQNGKDHKQILTSQGKYPGSNTTQEAVTVKVETGSVSVTAQDHERAGNLGCKQSWMEAEHGLAWVQVMGEPNSRYGNR